MNCESKHFDDSKSWARRDSKPRIPLLRDQTLRGRTAPTGAHLRQPARGCCSNVAIGSPGAAETGCDRCEMHGRACPTHEVAHLRAENRRLAIRVQALESALRAEAALAGGAR